MAILSVVLYNFNLNLIESLDLAGLSFPGLLIFVFIWLTSDLAVVLHLRQLAIVTHGKVFSVKFEEVPCSSGLVYKEDPPFFAPVLI